MRQYFIPKIIQYVIWCIWFVLLSQPHLAYGQTNSDEETFNNEANDESKRKIYLRVGGGLASNTHLVKILTGDFALDDRHTGIANIELGTPLVEQLNNWPIDIVGKVGYIRHFERGLQRDFNEYTISAKAYFYGFPWRNTIETRVGFAEGLSYAERIPFLEAEGFKQKNLPSSHLLNHLDVSVDVNLGDITRSKSLKKCFSGFAVSHRSGVFGKVGLFNHVQGSSSNYNMLYLECQVR